MWENVGMRVSGFFFSGSSVAKLDEKGRFVLPHEMRLGLVEEAQCAFSVGLGVGGCLCIYKKSAIAKIVAKFQEYQHVAKFQKFFTLFFSTLFQTEYDKVGRVMLPQALRSAVKIQKEIVVVGVMEKIELWPKEVYDATLREALEGNQSEEGLAKMTEEAFSLLGAPPLAQGSSVQAVEEALHPLYAIHKEKE